MSQDTINMIQHTNKWRKAAADASRKYLKTFDITFADSRNINDDNKVIKTAKQKRGTRSLKNLNTDADRAYDLGILPPAPTHTPKIHGGKRKTKRKTNKKRFRKTRSKKGGVKTRSGKDTSKVNKTNIKVIKKSIPVEEKEMCPICFEEFKKKDNIPKLPCKHKFHKECLFPVCNGKNNRNVPCPMCRGDITFACKSNITSAIPWTYDPYENPTANYTITDFQNMNMEEIREYHNEITRHRNNYLARRRRAIARETPQQTAQREEREQEHETRLREERDRAFYGRNDNHILTRGLPLPESPPRSPNSFNNSPITTLSPRSPDYPPNSPEGPPPGWIPNSPEGPPPLTMEDLRTSPSPTSSNYNPNSPPYDPNSPPYHPNSPDYSPGSPEGPPPLTIEDLETDGLNDNMRGGKKRKNRKTKRVKKSRKGRGRKSRK